MTTRRSRDYGVRIAPAPLTGFFSLLYTAISPLRCHARKYLLRKTLEAEQHLFPLYTKSAIRQFVHVFYLLITHIFTLESKMSFLINCFFLGTILELGSLEYNKKYFFYSSFGDANEAPGQFDPACTPSRFFY